jgi:hypothetical protein
LEYGVANVYVASLQMQATDRRITPSNHLFLPVLFAPKPKLKVKLKPLEKTRVSSRAVKKTHYRRNEETKRRALFPNTNQAGAAEFPVCLPRTREDELKQEQQQQHPSNKLEVIGVDEAGRGPLAGPVVAAAAIIPTDILESPIPKNHKGRNKGGTL